MSEERRKSPRFTSNRPDEVLLMSGSGSASVCRIQDISPYGMRFSVTRSSDAAHPAEGEELTVSGCPEILEDLLLNARCIVVWKKRSQCGAEFASPLEVRLDELGSSYNYIEY